MDPSPRRMAVGRSGMAPLAVHGHGRDPARDEEWRAWPSVRAFIPNLPPATTTYDIHKNLHRFGKVDFIRLEETRQGVFARSALVTFKPPPPRRAPWDSTYYRHGIEFVLREADGDKKYRVTVLLAGNQTSMRFVESPVRRGIKYSPEMTLHGEAIDFGYLERPNIMVAKATKRDPDHKAVKLFLNLDRLEIEVHFPVFMTSKGKSTIRDYRFFVALDDQFSMCEIPAAGDSSTSLVFHLTRPPWYSRQLKEAMQMSHDPKSLKWMADDTWSRQTDIVDDKETYSVINQTPISIQKLYNSIDIARWTTFRVTIPSNADASRSPVRHFVQALEDFNVPVTKNPSFKVLNGTPHGAPLWEMLNDSNNALSSLSEQLSAIHLDFDLRYQLEVCISQGWLNEYTIDKEFLQRLTSLPRQRAKQMLIHVDSYQERIYDPMTIFKDLRYSKPVRARALPTNCNEIYHATVTASGVLFHTPSVEITNRIIRKYERYNDRFLRVRFEDDSYRGKSRLYPATNGRMRLLFERVRRTLKHGIIIADRHYEFLAWGNSQLREHGAYFFASTHDITPDTIRRSMGIFDSEKVVAKRAARMGQCFSTTRAVSVLSKRAFHKRLIDDVIINGHTFTDGVGKISMLGAQLVCSSLKLRGKVPSAYQFRLGGCKGVLALDPLLPGVDIKIRLSQYKFQSESDELEIIRVSEFWQPFLNRQLILVLSDLGVPDEVFLQKQEDCIKALDRAMVDDTAALRALRDNVDPNLTTLSIAAMIEDGFRQSNEIFVTSLLRLYRAWTLKYLKEKAKIPVPQGAFVLGVVDETNKLRGHEPFVSPGSEPPTLQDLPQIFMQYTDQHTGQRRIVEGVCIIARNPSLHRGDIRVVHAVDIPALHHLCDVVVMPIQGERDLPSMCSGGDLDGDDYVVIWDPDLIPPQEEWFVEPFSYAAPKPVGKDEITTDDIINFFCDYMQNDFLGRIAHAHLAAADYLDEGIRSDVCLSLVNLHSKAVDYPKTGVPAEMPRELERNKWPHFMEKRRAPQYKSHKILGQLYDAVERVAFEPNWEGSFDQRILKHQLPPESVVEEVRRLKKSYDEGMRRIMAQHQINTEFEVWSTFVLHHSKAARDFKFHEEIGQHARTLKEQYYDVLVEHAGGRDFEKLMPMAVAAYHITYDEFRQAQEAVDGSVIDEVFSDAAGSRASSAGGPQAKEMPFISFPWVLQDILGRIARNTVLESESGRDKAASNRDEPSADLLLQLDDDPGATSHGQKAFKFFGDHMPDPYVPAGSESVKIKANGSGSGVTDDLLTGQDSPMKKTTSHLMDDDPDTSGKQQQQQQLQQPSLLLPIRTTANNSATARSSEDLMMSENSSIISSASALKSNSMFSSIRTATATPDDLYPPPSVLSGGSGPQPGKTSGLGPLASPLTTEQTIPKTAAMAQPAAAAAAAAAATVALEFGDPADDVENNGLLRAVDDDDDDDFTF
ncbi:RNA-dependent RNA polymerase 1 [Exophiala dermatitidis]